MRRKYSEYASAEFLTLKYENTEFQFYDSFMTLFLYTLFVEKYKLLTETYFQKNNSRKYNN